MGIISGEEEGPYMITSIVRRSSFLGNRSGDFAKGRISSYVNARDYVYC